RLIGRDAKNIGRWSQVRDNIVPIPQNGKVYLIYEGFEESWGPRHTRSHPSVLGPFFPAFAVPDDSLIRNTYEKVLAHWNWDEVWGWDFGFAAAVGAWLGRAEDAVNCLLKAESKMSPLVTFSGGGVESYLPGNGGIVLALNEMLLRSLDGTIRLFSGIPLTWNVKIDSLRAAGAFLISARRSNGSVNTITIKSLAGNLCRMELPAGWFYDRLQIKVNGESVGKEKVSGRIVEFPTEPNSTYELSQS
ncbi:MAG: glycoside hydrolase family 95-like protein, partial [Patescibacteria group bacterium]